MVPLTNSSLTISEAKTPNPLQLQSCTGFLGAFDYTLAPYIGCFYGCLYCYVPRILHGYAERRGGWGTFVDRRSQAKEQLLRQRDKLSGASLFLSATTDPYQPEESQAQLTRTLLETLADLPFGYLLISTRSGLVLRDSDILTDARMRDRVEIGISLPSDQEELHDQLEPKTASFRGRMKVASRLQGAGLRVRMHAAPLGHHSNDLWKKLSECATWVWIDGTGHGAMNITPCDELLCNYSSAKASSQQARVDLGPARVGYGQDQFAWRWNPIRQCIEPPPGRIYLPKPMKKREEGESVCSEK